MLFLSTRLPQLELPRFLRLPLLAGAGETGLLPLLLLELQGLLGLGADPCGLGLRRASRWRRLGLLGGGRCSVPGRGGLNRSVRQCSRR